MGSAISRRGSFSEETLRGINATKTRNKTKIKIRDQRNRLSKEKNVLCVVPQDRKIVGVNRLDFLTGKANKPLKHNR